MPNHDKPFKDETFGTKILIVITISFLLVFAITLFIGSYYFGILGIFKLLGVEYDSFLSLLLFVIFYFLLGIIGDLVVYAFSVLLSSIVFRPLTELTITFLINLLVNWSIISFLNFCMLSIEISIGTQIIASAIISIIEVVLENDDKKKEETLS